MQAIGMDGMSYLTTRDPIYSMAMVKLFEKARKEIDMADRERAHKIANAVGKLLG